MIGPEGFIGAWAVGAAVTSASYSSIDDAISRLAAVGSETRWLMTAGFVTFGLSLPVYGWALRSTVPGGAWITATATGLASLASRRGPEVKFDAEQEHRSIGVSCPTMAIMGESACRDDLAIVGSPWDNFGEIVNRRAKSSSIKS